MLTRYASNLISQSSPRDREGGGSRGVSGSGEHPGKQVTYLHLNRNSTKRKTD